MSEFDCFDETKKEKTLGKALMRQRLLKDNGDYYHDYSTSPFYTFCRAPKKAAPTPSLQQELDKALNDLAEFLRPMSVEERVNYLRRLGFDVSAESKEDQPSLQERYRKAEIDYIEAQAQYSAAEKAYSAAKENFINLEREIAEESPNRDLGK